MDNDLQKQSIMLIGGQENFDKLKEIWENMPTGGMAQIVNKVNSFKLKAVEAGFNHNQIMCFLEM